MKPISEKSIELYNVILRRGHPEPFCNDVTKNLNMDGTDFEQSMNNNNFGAFYANKDNRWRASNENTACDGSQF
jgi:hypothetical protein